MNRNIGLFDQEFSVLGMSVVSVPQWSTFSG